VPLFARPTLSQRGPRVDCRKRLQINVLSHCLTCLTYFETNKRMQNIQTTRRRPGISVLSAFSLGQVGQVQRIRALPRAHPRQPITPAKGAKVCAMKSAAAMR
jgi:hypothetical protein